jgi:hypothetical protein
MQFEYIQTFPGSPTPADLFEPYMPDVDLLSDMDGFFMQVRQLLEAEDTHEYIRQSGLGLFVPPDHQEQGAARGQRHVAIITPGRMISLAPAPRPNTKSEKELAPLRKLLPSETPLQITAISYTKLEAYLADTTKLKCIPFLGFLAGFAYVGHNVIVFEGHPSALESAVRNSDVLFIDDGMLPFMGNHWAEVVFNAMKPHPRVFLHERKNFQLTPIVRKSSPPGWRRGEPDGEHSYTNMLLTTLGKANYRKDCVTIIAGEAAPALREFASDPEELEYISTLPFKYDQLNTHFIVHYLWDIGKSENVMDRIRSTKTFKAKLFGSGGEARDVTFQFKLSKTSEGKQQLEIRLL